MSTSITWRWSCTTSTPIWRWYTRRGWKVNSPAQPCQWIHERPHPPRNPSRFVKQYRRIFRRPNCHNVDWYSQCLLHNTPSTNLWTNTTALSQRSEILKWLYGSAAPLCLGSGELLFHSNTGVRQDDSFASLFFCIALQPILKNIQDRKSVV